jgi:hypothetical protein
MPIIAYQSFNANSSSNHSTQAVSFQRFTKDTNANTKKRKHDILEYPQDPTDLATPIEGPAFKHEVPFLTKDMHTTNVFGNHISQTWQHFVREFGAMPNIMVIGELDSSHTDFNKIVGGSNVNLESFSQTKACQSFTAISQSDTGSQIKLVASDIGYVAYSVFDLNVVFVHVPNAIATDKGKMQVFYKQVSQKIKMGGDVIHLVLGDTNQKTLSFTADVLNSCFGVTAYQTAASQASLIDTYPLLTTGTNSTGKEMYDVAVYRSDLLDLEKAVYISQSPTGVTVTDHCGLGVSVKVKMTN